jgi:eukaryotic-like serine/threonine-protein kinase
MTLTLRRSAVSSGNDHDSVLDDVLEELANRLQAGDPVDCDAILERYPEHAESLRRLLPAIEVMAEFGVSASRLAARGVAPTSTTEFPEAELGTLGDFRILREVGRGGMGVVYEAEQISLGRRVALKVLPFAAALDPQQLQRFKTEAHAAAQLHHTNIVPVFWIGCERGVHYYAMQFIDGQTLAQAIAERRRMEAPQLAAADLARPFLGGRGSARAGGKRGSPGGSPSRESAPTQDVWRGSPDH